MKLRSFLISALVIGLGAFFQASAWAQADDLIEKTPFKMPPPLSAEQEWVCAGDLCLATPGGNPRKFPECGPVMDKYDEEMSKCPANGKPCPVCEHVKVDIPTAKHFYYEHCPDLEFFNKDVRNFTTSNFMAWIMSQDPTRTGYSIYQEWVRQGKEPSYGMKFVPFAKDPTLGKGSKQDLNKDPFDKTGQRCASAKYTWDGGSKWGGPLPTGLQEILIVNNGRTERVTVFNWANWYPNVQTRRTQYDPKNPPF